MLEGRSRRQTYNGAKTIPPPDCNQVYRSPSAKVGISEGRDRHDHGQNGAPGELPNLFDEIATKKDFFSDSRSQHQQNSVPIWRIHNRLLTRGDRRHVQVKQRDDDTEFNEHNSCQRDRSRTPNMTPFHVGREKPMELRGSRSTNVSHNRTASAQHHQIASRASSCPIELPCTTQSLIGSTPRSSAPA